MTDLTRSGIHALMNRQVDCEIARDFGSSPRPFQEIAMEISERLMASGKLRLSEAAATRIDIDAIVDLKAILAGSKRTYQIFERALTSHLFGVMLMAKRPRVNAETPEGRAELLEALTDSVFKLTTDLLEKGNHKEPQFGFTHLPSRSDKALRALPVFENFEVSLGDDQTLKPIPALVAKPIAHVSLPVPSGQLIICDFPQIEELITLTDAAQEGFSVEFAEERIGRVAAMVHEFSLAEVSGGAGFPDIYAHGGMLKFGKSAYNAHLDDWPDLSRAGPDPIQRLGSIIQEYHCTTLIDKSLLAQVLVEKAAMWPERAEQKIAAWLDAPVRRVAVVQVEPGTHHLYFGDYVYGGIDRIDAKACPRIEGFRMGMILSPAPLNLDPEIVRDLDIPIPVLAVPEPGPRPDY